MAINRCQYWNVYEPYPCNYWDAEGHRCVYAENTEQEAPPYAPYCNYIGTLAICPKYESSNPGSYLPTCMLPDPSRHVCNRWTGKKWVSISDGGPDFSPINGYNNGECNGNGTDTTCSGYSPQHMGFGRLVPSSDESVDAKEDISSFSTIMEFDYRLPLHFVIFNLRAKLSKCMWWDGEYLPFTINSETRLVELAGEWACSNENDTSSYSNFNSETGPPCNGCKPDCPYYSGICWEYCIDELLESGDPVMAEQLHELRYYCKENQWTIELMEDYFRDQGYIYTWAGDHFIDDDGAGVLQGDLNYSLSSEYGFIEEYQLPSVKTYMQDFNTFSVEHEDLVLTKGTEVDGELPIFPNLVQSFSLTQLNPIIKNRFETEGVFEVSKLGDTTVLLYGKIFTPGDVFVINISHDDVISAIPNELFEYDSLMDIKLNIGTKAYNEFYTRYERTIDTLKTLVVDVNNTNKLAGDGTTSFAVEAPLYPRRRVRNGINTFAVFHDSSEGLLFTKIDVDKRIVGGALIQNDFVLSGDNIPIRTPHDYTQGFYANVNEDNNQLVFEFVSFSVNGNSYDMVHYYDDTNFGDEGSNVSYLGYKYYKIFMEEYIVTTANDDEHVCEFFPLGDDGYFLIVLDILELTKVFQPWECGDIIATYEEGDGGSCDFEIVYSGSECDFLEVNQLIIKPKNSANFKSMCSATLTIKDLTYYQKFSFDEEPDTGWAYECLDNEDADISYGKSSYSVDIDDKKVVITDFQFTITPSIIIANSAGRPFTLFRTKPIGWVKQPKCPSVEIYYGWAANYTSWINVPVCTCCGPASQQNGEPSGHSMIPPCGDHDISTFTGVGPMWWPFNSCDTFTTYNIISNLDNYSFDVIGLFKRTNEDGEKEHGDHDMRMLGPSKFNAWHGRGCNFLMPCRCNWRTFGDEKNSDNTFIGYGRVRAGVSDAELQEWSEEGSVLPKFGNSYRPQLDSYLTLEKTQYLYTMDGETWSTGWRLMPAFMGFSKSDFLDNIDSVMWGYSASTIEGAAPVCNPLGFFKATSFEGVSINETIDYKNRFTLKEICHARSVVERLRYPNVVGKYASSKKEGKIYPWYEFKQYEPPQTAEDLFDDDGDGADGSGTIQWAWQEKWVPIERVSGEDYSKRSFIRSFLSSNLSNEELTTTLGGPFVVGTDGNLGMFKFLDISYPNYLYNYKTEEFTTVIAEGYHVLRFIAPEKDESTGEYNGYIKIQLDGGPVRGISWEGKDWLNEDNISASIEVDEEEYNFEIYEEFTGQNESEFSGSEEKLWFDEVTLFDTNCPLKVDGAFDGAENSERMVETYYLDEAGETVTKKTHFQNGLAVSINSEAFIGSFLPTILLSVKTNVAEQNNVGSESEQVVMVCGTGDLNTAVASFDNKVKTISSAEITYTYGAVLVEESTQSSEDRSNELTESSNEPKKPIYNYYHLPAVSIYTSSDGVTKETLLYEKDYITFYLDSSVGETIETITHSWDNTLEYIMTGSLYIIIEFRATPIDSELAALTEEELAVYNKSINYASYNIFDIYEAILTDAYEPIKTTERKYYVSYGNSGDSPPQGTDPEEISTLYVRSIEKSTPYTRDYSDGVLNMDGSDSDSFKIMSKVRGRILGKLYEDEEALTGDIWEMEREQKKLFDAAFNMSTPWSVMEPVIIPSLTKFLDEENISFFGTFFTLENTILAELAEINQFEPMSGEGHKYIPNYENFYDKKCTMYCGSPESAMEWVYTCMDEEANSTYTGQGYDNAAYAYYWGTYNYLQRRDLAEAVIKNVFSKEYGGSSANKIWANDEESELVLPTLFPTFLNAAAPTTQVSYNLEYLKLSMNWQNAYFNTAENYEVSPILNEGDTIVPT
jgi:hypothetical protein